MLKMSADQMEAAKEARRILAGPNVSVAGGELAWRKYLAALQAFDYILENCEIEDEPNPESQHSTDPDGSGSV